MKASLVLAFLFLVAVQKSYADGQKNIFRYRDEDGYIRMGILRKPESQKPFSIVPSSSDESSQQSDSDDSEILREDISAYLHEYSRRIGPHENADSVQEMFNISEERLIAADDKGAEFDNSPEAHRTHNFYIKARESHDCDKKHTYVYKQKPIVFRPKGANVVVNTKPIYVHPPPLVVHQPAPKPCNPVINYQPPSIKIRPVIVESKKPCKKSKTRKDSYSWEKFKKSSYSWEKKDSNEYKVYYHGHNKNHKYDHHHFNAKPSHSSSVEKEEKPIWTYGKNDKFGPQNWGKIAAACDGNRQSPIALYTHKARNSDNAKPLKIDGLDLMPKSLKYENDGDSFDLKFNYAKGKKVKISGGPLKVPYILAGVHWHWGKTDEAGSEHTLDSKRYSSELHLVFYNSNYESITEAIKTPKGLAVLGILYELDDFADNPWAAYAKKVIKQKSSYTETRNLFPLRELVQDDDFNILTYKGSLTNPDCNENVTWMVSTKPLPISSSDLNGFRKLRDIKGNPILKNFRPLQKRNGRVITEYN